jgi:hypothetical protein
VSGETDPPWLWLRDPETWWYGEFFPWFSTDLICWKRISPKKNCLEHNLQSRIWG